MSKRREFQEFYNGLVDLDHGDKRVHYSALFVDKTIVATHVGLSDNDTFYYIMPCDNINIDFKGIASP